LIIAAYAVNDAIVGQYESSDQSVSRCAATGLIVLTGLFTGGTIVFLVYQFIWFHGCAGTIVIIAATCVLMIAFYALVLLRTRKDASIFTSSVVSLYVAYLGWSAMASMPKDTCNPFTVSKPNTIAQIFVGMFFTFVSLFTISAIT